MRQHMQIRTVLKKPTHLCIQAATLIQLDFHGELYGRLPVNATMLISYVKKVHQEQIKGVIPKFWLFFSLPPTCVPLSNCKIMSS